MDKQPISVRLPAGLYERLRLAAFKLRVPMSKIIIEGIEERVARLETSGKAVTSAAPVSADTLPAPDAGAQDPDAIALLRDRARMLARIVAGSVQVMEAARIEMRQNGSDAAMQWIINAIGPDVKDWEPGEEWDGSESAQAWFDRISAVPATDATTQEK